MRSVAGRAISSAYPSEQAGTGSCAESLMWRGRLVLVEAGRFDGSVVAVAAGRVRVAHYRTAVVIDGECARQRWPSQPVGDVKQPTSDQHPFGRHGDPRHLVAPV